MCGAGCHGAAEELRALSDRLKAPLNAIFSRATGELFPSIKKEGRAPIKNSGAGAEMMRPLIPQCIKVVKFAPRGPTPHLRRPSLAISLRRSADVIDSSLVCGLFDCFRLRRQLQHHGLLAFAQQCQQHRPAVGKF
jgi:hypothetical protein